MKRRLKQGGGDQSGNEMKSGKGSVSVSPIESESTYDSSTYSDSIDHTKYYGGGALSTYLKKAKSCFTKSRPSPENNNNTKIQTRRSKQQLSRSQHRYTQCFWYFIVQD
jgi:hypothetical protein